MSPPNGDEFDSLADGGFGFPQEIEEQVSPFSVARSQLRGAAQDFLPEEAAQVVEVAADLDSVMTLGLGDELARIFAGAMRGECLSVRLPGLPGGEYIAQAANWWARQAVDAFGQPVRAVGDANERINARIQDALGIPGANLHPEDKRPLARPGLAPGEDGFLVKVPNWEDIFVFNNDKVFDERDKRQRFLDMKEALERSPTPPALAEMGELLTTLDDLQDEAATLAVVLMIAQKLAGRAIPGVGWVATAADALNIIYAVASAGTGSSLPGKRGKRRAVDKARSSSGGLAGRFEDLRRSGALKIGLSDLLQGLQASESVFGTGIQLGGIFGFLQDATWGAIRGAEFEAQGPIWDPLGFTEAGKSACYNSPTLEQIHPRAHFAMSHMALGVWSKAARIAPYVDIFGESALASMLTGMRLSEQVLGPWLRSGAWVDPLKRLIEVKPFVGGGVTEHDTRHLRPDEWMSRTQPAARVAFKRALGNVEDRGRQGFYDSLASSIGWGLIADIEPNSRVVEQHLIGPARDAALLLEAGKIPRFDLED